MGEAHYAAPGLTPAATNEEIRSAYRRLATQHHPDRDASWAPGPSRRRAATSGEITDACEELRRLRGI